MINYKKQTSLLKSGIAVKLHFFKSLFLLERWDDICLALHV